MSPRSSGSGGPSGEGTAAAHGRSAGSAWPPERPIGIALLGCTGSIGRQAVDVLARHPDAFRVVALATGRAADVLAEQAALLRPAVVAIADETAAAGLDLPAGTVRIRGDDALERLATRD